MDRAIDLRSKCPHFRILVVGRANAGKTTLLKRVCNSVQDPEIFTPEGKRLDLAIVEGSTERGEHNIENQLVFKSNRQFIFHDSRGFESGSADEIQKVKDFITARSATRKLSHQLHAIWYCIPYGHQPAAIGSRRTVLRDFWNRERHAECFVADEELMQSFLFPVPVIAIFTKFDGLIKETFNELRGRGKNISDAKNGAPHQAQAMLTSNFIGPLNITKFRPSDFVRLDDMRMEQSDCIDLINKTAHALSDDTLRLLFVSVQQNNIDLCIASAVTNVLRSTDDDVRKLVREAISWFPHVWAQRVSMKV
ncbi:GTP-binding protein [Mycena sanguinolenta]|uniref:GTP-binding protein n=1 Tax=Mycena sanguinolenta TaxID=230812 RepID=A0A8H7CFD4_9AGAR|nr:GTP-binding protein [Mycena sanguinolenta]